jgi:hypothetical protein
MSMLSELLMHDGKTACENAGLQAQRGVSIPNFHMLVKLHKEPLGFRYVAGSPHAPYTPISKALNTVFKALDPAMKSIWDNIAMRVPLVTREHLAGRTGFIINNTAKAAKFAMRFQRPRRMRDPKLHLSTWDFSNMYTTLPHADLVERISGLFTEIF